MSPDDLSHMIDLTEEFTFNSYPDALDSEGREKKYNPNLVDPKVAQFLRELKEIYPEEDFNSLDVTSAFRDVDFNKSIGGVEDSAHLHGLALDFSGESGKELMDFLLNDPKGKKLMEKWGEGGNMGNGIHDEFDREGYNPHLHIMLKRAEIDNSSYQSQEKKPIVIGEPIDDVVDDEVIEDDETADDEVVDDEVIEDGEVLDFSNTILATNDDFSKENLFYEGTNELKTLADFGDDVGLTIADSYIADVYGQYITGPTYDGTLSNSDINNFINSVQDKIYTEDGNKSIFSRFRIPDIYNLPENVNFDSLGGDESMRKILIPARDVVYAYGEDEFGNETIKIIDPIFGEFTSTMTGNKTGEDILKHQAFHEYNQLINAYMQGHPDAFMDGSSVAGSEGKYAWLGQDVATAEVGNNFHSQSHFVNMVDLAYSGDAYKGDDFLKKEGVFSSAPDGYFYLHLDDNADDYIYSGDSYLYNERTKENKFVSGHYWENSPMNPDSPNYGKNGFGDYQDMSYDNYFGFSQMLNDPEYLLSDDKFDRLAEAIKQTKNDLDFSGDMKDLFSYNFNEDYLWDIYFSTGANKNFNEYYNEEDWKQLRYYEGKLAYMADTGQWGGGMDIGGGGWGEDYTRWLELKEREQLHFIMWAQDHNKGNMSALDAAIRGDDPDNNPLAQIEKKQDEIDKIQDELIIIKNKLELPAGYTIVDREEYETRESLVNEYNELLEEAIGYEEEANKIIMDNPMVQALNGYYKINESIIDSMSKKAGTVPPTLERFYEYQAKRIREADEDYEDRSWVGKGRWWIGGFVDELIGGISEGLYIDLPTTIDAYTGSDDRYSWWDERKDDYALEKNLGYHGALSSGFKTTHQRGMGGFSQTYIDMGDGFRAMLDGDGEFSHIVEMVDGSMIQPSYQDNKRMTQKYQQDKEDGTLGSVKKETNYTAGFNMLSDAFAGFGSDLLFTYTTFGAGKAMGLGKLGIGSKANWFRVSMGTSMFVRTQGDFYDAAKAQGLSDSEAANYALIMGTAMGLSNALISPNLSILGGATNVTKGGTKNAVRTMLMGATNKQVRNAAMYHMGREAIREGGQEIADEFIEKGINRMYNSYKKTDFDVTSSLDEIRDVFLAGSLIGGSVGVKSRPTANHLETGAMYKYYKNQAETNKALDRMVGETMIIGSKKVKIDKTFIKNKKDEYKHLFNQVDELKSKSKVKLSQNEDAHLVSLLKERSVRESLQNHPQFGEQMKSQIKTLDGHISNILKGKKVEEIFFEDSLFNKMGINMENVAFPAKYAERMLRKGKGFSNVNKEATIIGLESSVQELNKKKKLTKQEQQLKGVYETLIKKVKKQKPIVNEKFSEQERISISRAANGLRGKAKQLAQRLKGQGLGKTVGALSGTEEVVLDDSSRINDTVGKQVIYKGKKGILSKNKKGDFVLKSGKRFIKIDNATGNKMLKTVGLSVDPVTMSIDGDKLIINRGKGQRILRVTRGKDGNIGGVLTMDESTYSDPKKRKKAENQLNKLSEQYGNGEISLEQFIKEAKKIKGVNFISDKNISLDVAANEIISQLMKVTDVAAIDPKLIDSIIEEVSQEQKAIQKEISKFKKEEEKVKKEIKKQTRSIKEKIKEEPGDVIKPDDSNRLDEMSNMHSDAANRGQDVANNRRKARVLSIAKKVLSSLGFDIVVHQDKESVFNHFIKMGYDYEFALKASENAKGWIYSDKGKIHVNLDNASPNTLLHEASHPFISLLKNLSKKKTPKGKEAKKVLDEAKKILSTKKMYNQGNKSYLDWAREAYKGMVPDNKLEEVALEEAFAEYLGDQARFQFDVDNSFFLRTWNKILTLFGKGRMTIPSSFDPSNATLDDVSNFADFERIVVGSTARGLGQDIVNIDTVKDLKPDLAFQVSPPLDSKGFKNWFGKSKMVNKKGEPEVWYHGTAGAFEAFDRPELAKDVPGKKRGIFFTKDPKFAGDFAKLKGMKMVRKPVGTQFKTETAYEGSNIIPAYLSIKNPFDYDNKKSVQKLYDGINSRMGQESLNLKVGESSGLDVVDNWKSRLEKGQWTAIEQFDFEPVGDILNVGSIPALIQDVGFDGYYVAEGGTKNIAAFEPKQVRSVFREDFSDIESPKFQMNLNNIGLSVNNLAIDRATSSEWISKIKLNGNNNTELEMDFIGLENYLKGLETTYDDNLIPLQDVLDYVEMNKVNVEKTANNQISFVNPMMQLGRANIKVLDKQSLLVESLEGVDFGGLETVFKNIIRYASDRNLSDVIFSDGVISSDSVFSILEEAAQSLDKNNMIGLTEMEGQSLNTVSVTENVIKNSTKLSLPSFQMSNVDPSESDIKIWKGSLGYVGHQLWDKLVPGGLKSRSILEREFQRNGGVNAIINEAQYITQEITNLIKKYESDGITAKDVNDALRDPSLRINNLKQEVKSTNKDMKILELFGEQSRLFIDNKRRLKEKKDTIKTLRQTQKNKTNIDSLPEDLANAVVRARALIDKLSRTLKDSGYLSSEQVATFEANEGIYMKRSYRAHLNRGGFTGILDRFRGRKWDAKTILNNNKFSQIKTIAEDFFINQIAEEKGIPKEQVSAQEVENRITKVLNSDEQNFFEIISKVSTASPKILRKRKDLPDAIRTLLGEINDPIYNILETVSSQARFLQSTKYHQWLVDAYGGSLLLDEVTFSRKYNRTFNSPITLFKGTPQEKTYYTLPEFTETFIGQEGESLFKGTSPITRAASAFLNTYIRMTGVWKMNKTVFSPVTQIRNFKANFFYAVNNMHLGALTGNHLDGFRVTWSEMGKKNKGQKQELYRELLEYGIAEDSAGLEELQYILSKGGWKYFADPKWNPDTELEGIGQSLTSPISWVGDKLSSVKKASLSLYMFGDVSWKAYGWLHEVDRYKKAGYSDQDAKKEAARIIRDTYPTYSMVPKVVKALGFAPFGGSFVSYPFEMYRTSVMTARQAIKELSSGNAELIKVGMKRLAGSSIHGGLGTMILGLELKAMGMVFHALSKAFGDEDDEEKENYDSKGFKIGKFTPELMNDNDLAEKFRKLVPEWDVGGEIIIVGHPEEGVFYYVNINTLDSHGGMRELYNMMTKDVDDPTRDPKGLPWWSFGYESLYTFGKPFLTYDMVYNAFNAALSNDKNPDIDGKQQIFNPYDDDFSQVIDILGYLAKEGMPGIFSNVDNIYTAATQDDDVYRHPTDPQRDKEIQSELKALLGVKENVFNVQHTFYYKALNLKQLISKRVAERNINENAAQDIVDYINHFREIVQICDDLGANLTYYEPKREGMTPVQGSEGAGKLVMATIMEDLGFPSDLTFLIRNLDMEVNVKDIERLYPEFEKMLEEGLEKQNR